MLLWVLGDLYLWWCIGNLIVFRLIKRVTQQSCNSGVLVQEQWRARTVSISIECAVQLAFGVKVANDFAVKSEGHAQNTLTLGVAHSQFADLDSLRILLGRQIYS